MDERPRISYEQKLYAASQLREASPDQIVTYLDGVSNIWSFGILFPGGGKKTIDCVIPKNEHQRDDTHKYICQDLSTGPHSFCLYHDLVKDKCPIDGTDLTQVTA